MKTLSAEEAERLVSQISSQHGFIDYTDAGRQRRIITAFPIKHWPIPKDALAFSCLAEELEQAWAGLAQEQGRELAGGIMGTLFYEAGNHTVPGFSGDASAGDYGYVGLYLWQLTLDVSGANSPRLDFHPECDDRTRERVLNLTGEKPTRPTPFHISPGFTADQPAEHYRNGVSRVLSYIHAGDCYQVNLSNKYTGGYQGEPYTAFRALCQAVPVPHAAYINAGSYQVLSISPELFLSIEDGNRVISKPIKGTRPRDLNSPANDQRIAESLAAAEKDRAENLMIVDLIRNDLSRFCEPFSVTVPQLFSIESYENVHQLVSTVEGRLQPENTPLKALLSAFPGGSITGAPKRRAMEIIDDLEPHRRGPYCGSVFRWDFSNNLESNIAIRTLMTDSEGKIHCWAGCGIVADSDPDDEYRESVDKVQKLMSVLEAL
ncbi:aminodeoxychorismate synthase component I [Marinobacter salarius]|uniref:Aminodeoxychorismate synthase component 1 n=1 Tax=Marinobacter salarius TaxID=1420917 RepID=A0A1W6K9W1_9GAMM|nr:MULTISPECIES: aminodeoxychorismate synthase component I [Marinobacter]ARM84112.1 aminodeoxychorismate synthase component 1 [Marinobacter salarius]MBJ7300083.1 aminodeoxychorismate synthase component I [Marinobacter salarius]MCC4282328.1 aminodeoxychorismate synthase component I [Marinobacter salarius]MDP4532554.1 aminodeoxychorismate synthase component I [Marinobacter salarius]HIO30850.1 aminodeoxychorismate synthase component I [Marinobacter salarius]